MLSVSGFNRSYPILASTTMAVPADDKETTPSLYFSGKEQLLKEGIKYTKWTPLSEKEVETLHGELSQVWPQTETIAIPAFQENMQKTERLLDKYGLRFTPAGKAHPIFGPSDMYVWSNTITMNPNIRESVYHLYARKVPAEIVTLHNAFRKTPVTMEAIPMVTHGIESKMQALMTLFTQNDLEQLLTFFKKNGVTHNPEKIRAAFETNHGFPPIQVQALPSGSHIRAGAPFVQVTSGEGAPWAPQVIENLLLESWPQILRATKAEQLYQYGIRLAEEIGLPKDSWSSYAGRRIADFSGRASAGIEDAVQLPKSNFVGGMQAASVAGSSYETQSAEEGLGIPAGASMSHATVMTEAPVREHAVFERMLAANKNGAASYLADTHNFPRAVSTLLDLVEHTVLKQPEDYKGCVVGIRPDSGNPIQNVEEIYRQAAKRGLVKFVTLTGTDGSKKVFQQLDPHIGIFLADGINVQTMIQMDQQLLDKGFFPFDVKYGIGSGFAKGARDDFGLVYKLAAIKHENSKDWVPVLKSAEGKMSVPGIIAHIDEPDQPTIVTQAKAKALKFKDQMALIFDALNAKKEVLIRDESLADMAKRRANDYNEDRFQGRPVLSQEIRDLQTALNQRR